MEHLGLSVRFEPPGDSGAFSGHAAIFDTPNRHGELVARGAFRKSLAEHKAAGTRPLMLWAHDLSDVIGVWTDIREDQTGLAVSGRLITETRRGAEAHALLKGGALDGLSIGFSVRGDKLGLNGLRTLTDIELVEISLVGLPSARGARVTEVRARSDGLSTFAEACRHARCALLAMKDSR